MTRGRVLLVLAAFAGPALAAVPEPDAYRLDHYREPVPDTLHGARVVSAAELAALIQAEQPVLIDVLPAPAAPADARPGLPRMPVPHRDIPGSHWLADTGRGALAPSMEAWFRARLRQISGARLDSTLVFYCLSQCWMSWNAARRAVSYGYTKVVWFPGGADGWEASGHALAPAPAPERAPRDVHSSLSAVPAMP